MHNISFKANFISPSTIRRYNTIKGFQEIKASFVELNPHCYKDRKALESVDALWKNETFAHSMVNDLDKVIIWRNPNIKYFAITSQKRQFEELIPNKILGLAEIITGPKRIKLKYLQSDPENNMHSMNFKFRGIGTAILNSLKSLFPTSDIVLQTTESAREFYKANGFEEINSLDEMIFRHSKEADLPK